MAEKKKTFQVHVVLSVTDTTSSYDNKTMAKFDLTEAVPEGIEPVDHLRNLVKANFARVFGPVASITVASDEVPF